MAFRPAPAKGGWFNPAGIKAWKDAATCYSQMSDRVEPSARTAAETHIAGPAREAGAHSATRVFHDGDNMFVGVPDDHPEAVAARDIELGTEMVEPQPHLRMSVWNNGREAVETFHGGLVGR